MSALSVPLQHWAFAILTCLLSIAGFTAEAMDFTTGLLDGKQIVLARGVIVEGDADRLRAALASADRSAEGLRTIAFDSPGGAVGEALAMAAIMDKEKVAVVVRPGSSCASACAQIVFFAGVYRTVHDGGRLGLHSCRRAGTAAREPICNEMIAQQAAARGAPYGTLMAFMQLTDPGQIRWLDAEDADCWGLTIWPKENDRGIKRGDLPPCLLHGVNPKRSHTARLD